MSLRFVGRIILLAGAVHTAAWLIVAYWTLRQEWAAMDAYGPLAVKASIGFPVLILVPYFIAAHAAVMQPGREEARRNLHRRWVGFVLAPWLIYVFLLFAALTLFERKPWFSCPPLILGIAVISYGRWMMKRFPEANEP